jgi:outer membrane receptor for ferrienterochelin and colicin
VWEIIGKYKDRNKVYESKDYIHKNVKSQVQNPDRGKNMQDAYLNIRIIYTFAPLFAKNMAFADSLRGAVIKRISKMKKLVTVWLACMVQAGGVCSETGDIVLEEVVVTGQGAEIEKRRLSSGAVSIGSEELQHYNHGRLDQLLQNALPGVQITLATGQPGATSFFKARGISSAFSNATPVIFVDGVRIDNLNTGATLNIVEGYYGVFVGTTGQTAASGAIGDIPLENIDRIEYVSGGAATTLYGSDAANGAIQIFTKKGGAGKALSVETELGVEMATDQFYHFNRTAELLHQTGFVQKYRVGFDGGNDKMGYSFGGNMSSSTGTIVQNANESRKYDLRLGTGVKLSHTAKYESSFSLVAGEFRRSRNGNQGGYTGLWFTECAAASDFSYTACTGGTAMFGADIDALNDYAFSQMKTFVNEAERLQNNRETVRRFQTSQSFVFTPAVNLTFKGVVGLDSRVNTNKNIYTNEYWVHVQEKPAGTSDAGSIFNFNRNYSGITVDVNGQYKWFFSDRLSIITAAGYQYFSTYDHQTNSTGNGVRDGALIISGAATTTAEEWLSYFYSYGFFTQKNIGIKNRYFIDWGFRGDYNTAFGDNVGRQYYPKIGFSYLVSEEPFMRSLRQNKLVNSLQLRANYGVAGNYPPPFKYQKTIAYGSYRNQQTVSFGNYGNPDLAPEKKHASEAGLSALLFDRRLNLGFTAYYVLTKDALFNVPLLPSQGQSAGYTENLGQTANYPANVGVIENRGIEFSCGLQLLNTKDWNVLLNVSCNTNHNEVLDIGGAVPFSIGGFSSATVQAVVAENKPVGFIRGTKTILNDDGSVKETLELQDLGSTIPTVYGNLSLSAAYRNWSLFVCGDYQAGSYVHSFDRQFRFSRGLKDAAIPDKALEGTSQAAQWLNFTNFFVEKADFFKIRNISLSCTVQPSRFLKSAVFSISIYNPLSFTASSVDPEAVLSGALTQGAAATGGFNYATSSLSRQFIGAVKVNF